MFLEREIWEREREGKWRQPFPEVCRNDVGESLWEGSTGTGSVLPGEDRGDGSIRNNNICNRKSLLSTS